MRIPQNLVREHDVKNFYLVLNGFERNNGYYGSTYTGYYHSGYYAEEAGVTRPKWQFWKRG